MLDLLRKSFLLLVLLPVASFAQSVLADVGPVAVDFGAVKIGATVTVPVTIHNLGTTALHLSGGGFSSPPAYSGSNGSCGSYVSSGIPAGGSCAFSYSFTPTDASGTPITGSTSIGLYDGSNGKSVALNFTGSGTEALAQVTPVSIDFGETFIGQSVLVPVTVTNNHTTSLTFSGGGTGAGSFGATSSCGGSLAVGSSCVFNYTFTPSAAGLVSVDTDIGANSSSPAVGQNFAIHLQGTGTTSVPNIDQWPVTIDFGAIKVGHSVSVPLYFKNYTASVVNIDGGGFNSTVFAGFAPSGSGCTSSTVQSGATCTSNHTFQPLAATSYSATTSFGFYNSNFSISLLTTVLGTGVGTLARVSPVTANLGTVSFGQNQTVPVVITNTSDAPLSNFVGGSVASPFAASSTCPTGTSNLAVGSTCQITYTFSAPSAHSSYQVLYSATTLLSFTNSTGIQPTVTITLNAIDGDRIFGNGLE